MDLNEFGKPGSYKEGVKPQEENGKPQEPVPQGKTPSCAQNTSYYIEEFLNRTTINGCNYLAERGRTFLEKLWWSVIILTALYLCISQILQAYDKWINSPVIVTFATTQTPIWKIPFPAVTICPEIKSRKERFNFTDVYLKMKDNVEVTGDELRDFQYMSLICKAGKNMVNESLAITDERAMDFITEVAPTLNDMFYKVVWRGTNYKGENLKELFVPMLTSEGICYTFNLMDRTEIFTDVVTHYRDCFSTNGKHSQWSSETGYTEDSDLDSYPQRTLIAGVKGGLSIIFNTNHDDMDYICGESLQGYKISLHNPAEIPRLKQKFLRVPLDHSVIASIKPYMMSTAGELVNYKPEHRQCYFSREKQLKYFKIYNQENCLLECLTDYMLEICGCVGFQLPRLKSTPICGAFNRDCMEVAKADFLKSEVAANIKKAEKGSNSPKSKLEEQLEQTSVTEKCNCLPSCTSLDFEVESSPCQWDWKAFFEVQRQFPQGVNNSHFSTVQLLFKDMQFITSERNELYGPTDFWANCGGLLGLFTGFSFISFFEILYYLTLRLVCNLKKYGRHYWSGSEKLLETKDK